VKTWLILDKNQHVLFAKTRMRRLLSQYGIKENSPTMTRLSWANDLAAEKNTYERNKQRTGPIATEKKSGSKYWKRNIFS
jgi:hypothetical protein